MQLTTRGVARPRACESLARCHHEQESNSLASRAPVFLAVACGATISLSRCGVCGATMSLPRCQLFFWRRVSARAHTSCCHVSCVPPCARTTAIPVSCPDDRARGGQEGERARGRAGVREGGINRCNANALKVEKKEDRTTGKQRPSKRSQQHTSDCGERQGECARAQRQQSQSACAGRANKARAGT